MTCLSLLFHPFFLKHNVYNLFYNLPYNLFLQKNNLLSDLEKNKIFTSKFA